jgi:hypothetical protein
MKISSKLLGLLLIMVVPAWVHAQGQAQLQAETQSQPQTQAPAPPHPAQVGDVNYVEGQASIDGRGLNSGSVGTVRFDTNQTLTTRNGRVEILLTPGVFLRVDNMSSVKMIAEGLTLIQVELQKGRASIEAVDLHKDNEIRVLQNGASTRILKNGLYEFNADNRQVLVFKGKADVYFGDQKKSLGGEKETTINSGAKLESHGFDTEQYADDFYRWGGLRSAYLSEATVDAAHDYIGNEAGYGPGWVGPGWYWSPWFDTWTFLPNNGIFYSPFGWGYYSPILIYRSPYFYYGYRRPHIFGDFHGPFGHGFEPPGGFRSGGNRGGIPGGVRRGGIPRAGGVRPGGRR